MTLDRNRKILLLIFVSLMIVSLIFQGYSGGLSLPEAVNKQHLLSDSNVVAPSAVVGISKGDKFTASDLNYSEIKDLVSRAIESAGGFDDIIEDGYTVVLKPNLISAYDMTNNSRNLPPEANGMTTDYRVTRAVVELVRELNPGGKVFVLEGVANDNTRHNMSILNYSSEHIPGVDEFIYLEEASGGWKEYDSPLLKEVTLPEGAALYPNSRKPNNSDAFYLNKIYYEADVLISLPVLKNHSQANITGAVKNVGIGGTPTNIYGGVRGDNHRFVNSTIDHTPSYLHRWIHDYYMCRPVDFVIMDGLQGSEDGPVGITGHNLRSVQKNKQLILAGKDAVAVDAIACLIMGYYPNKIGHLVHLHNSLAGCAEPAFIRVNGTQVHEVKETFTNGVKQDVNAWYTDFEAPDFSVYSLEVDGCDLKLNLKVDEETQKVEVEIDGNLLDEIAVKDFNNISFHICDLTGDDHNINIYVYDYFLNRSTYSGKLVTDVEFESPEFPDSFQLFQNYPNPFNPTTTIEYNIPSNVISHPINMSGEKSSEISPYGRNDIVIVKLKIYDILGRQVATLVDKQQSSGTHRINFNATTLSSGIYYYNLISGEFSETRKMILLR